MKTLLLSTAFALTAASAALAANGPGSPSPTAPGAPVTPSLTTVAPGVPTFFSYDFTPGGTVVFTLTGETGAGLLY